MKSDIGVQYLMDENGDKAAIIIPMERWMTIASNLTEFFEYQSLRKNLGSAFQDVVSLKGQTMANPNQMSFFE
ncbi:MAG: hypothetical protein AAFQ02_06670 [Bacteroidota bacterium]